MGRPPIQFFGGPPRSPPMCRLFQKRLIEQVVEARLALQGFVYQCLRLASVNLCVANWANKTLKHLNRFNRRHKRKGQLTPKTDVFSAFRKKLPLFHQQISTNNMLGLFQNCAEIFKDQSGRQSNTRKMSKSTSEGGKLLKFVLRRPH